MELSCWWREGWGPSQKKLTEAAIKERVRLHTNRAVKSFILEKGVIKGAKMSDGTTIMAKTVVVNADPFRMRDMIGKQNLPEKYNKRIDAYLKDGTTMKINMCMKDLPKFSCLPNPPAKFGPTIHIMPQGENVIEELRKSYKEIGEGKLSDFPSMEWYQHSAIDPSIRGGSKYHGAALFVQWVPFNIKGSSWEKEEKRYVQHLLSILDRFAPGTSSLVAETFVLNPQKLEKHFGITRGHIHHVDNSFGFNDRLPYDTPITGLYSCSSGCHPCGSVSGCNGHNAAMRILKDLSQADKGNSNSTFKSTSKL